MNENSNRENRLFFILLLHIGGWLFFFFLPFLAGMPIDNTRLQIKFASHTAIMAVFFYTNSYLLIPMFLKKGKMSIYILYVLLGVVLIFFYYQAIDNLLLQDMKEAEQWVRNGNPQMRSARKIYGPIFSAVFIFALSTSITITSEWMKNEKRRKEMENEKLISELAFLKSQVSPHFLFNTLNNIYSLSLSASEHTSEAIMKLSHLLRYMLYESQDKMVSLQKEVDYLRNYIDLQKIRISKEVKINFEVQGNVSSEMIEPMLLIPFVENAFKHGVNYSEKSFVTIFIEVSSGKLFMKVENSYYPTNKDTNKNSGIGLANVIKRMELLYPGRHRLNIRQNGNRYSTELTMNLHI